jgi:hypothetical protein
MRVIDQLPVGEYDVAKAVCQGLVRVPQPDAGQNGILQNYKTVAVPPRYVREASKKDRFLKRYIGVWWIVASRPGFLVGAVPGCGSIPSSPDEAWAKSRVPRSFEAEAHRTTSTITHTMRQRITFIHEPQDSIDPQLITVTDDSLSIKGEVKASREEKITFGLSELPQELYLVLKEIYELHIRWASPEQYPLLLPLVSRTSPGLHVFYTPQRNSNASYVGELDTPRALLKTGMQRTTMPFPKKRLRGPEL